MQYLLLGLKLKINEVMAKEMHKQTCVYVYTYVCMEYIKIGTTWAVWSPDIEEGQQAASAQSYKPSEPREGVPSLPQATIAPK